ncbi:MAG: alpha/beta hydrolase, partial [Pseudomonadota bacterium]
MPEPLLLIPGLMCTSDLFTPQIRAFSGDRQVFVADHSGADDMRSIAGQILSDAPARFMLAGLSM